MKVSTEISKSKFWFRWKYYNFTNERMLFITILDFKIKFIQNKYS